MSSLALVRRLHQHRRWVNDQLRQSAAMLPADSLQREFAIGQGTAWRTLLHLYGAEYVWLKTIQGDPRAAMPGDAPGELPGGQSGQGGITNAAELVTAWDRLEDEWQAFLAGLTEADLSRMVRRQSTSSGRGRELETPLSDVLLHVCTHAQYTTAQLVNMLRHLGVSPLPDAMLISLSRREHNVM